MTSVPTTTDFQTLQRIVLENNVLTCRNSVETVLFQQLAVATCWADSVVFNCAEINTLLDKAKHVLDPKRLGHIGQYRVVKDTDTDYDFLTSLVEKYRVARTKFATNVNKILKVTLPSSFTNIEVSRSILVDTIRDLIRSVVQDQSQKVISEFKTITDSARLYKADSAFTHKAVFDITELLDPIITLEEFNEKMDLLEPVLNARISALKSAIEELTSFTKPPVDARIQSLEQELKIAHERIAAFEEADRQRRELLKQMM